MTPHLMIGVRAVLLLPNSSAFCALKPLKLIILLHLLKPLALTSVLMTCDALELCMQCSDSILIVLAFFLDRN